MRVLIAEDEVEIARALKVMLEKNKYTVDIVHNGTDALDYIFLCDYDVIVLDIMMRMQNQTKHSFDFNLPGIILIDEIENIIIQGHTDSQMFSGARTPEEQYMKNMTLSLQRANSVAEYIFQTSYNKQYSEKLKKILVVEGKSYSEPILVNGKEDYNKSRRVEMRLKTKKLDITEILFSGAQYGD